MQKLSKMTFDRFTARRGVAAVMFVSPLGEASMRQAIDFAVTWTRHPRMAFGYVNSFDEVALSRFFEIRLLPTTLVMRDGREVARLEGGHCSLSISHAVEAATEFAAAI